ncbi:molybdopterin-guanine dinucleotide biosynthesis protein B [Staphylococcus arlettae]|uniref:molybdopterin-guanine dinucleotide biosynthesis protein B n=1 Tax=Staphylococcus arlettae TaxID=29378 RepID=UPI001E5275D1|nr:molybdopterin-guanine dinucleotide biosynthesis protein B [Staphylococcus arlettae]MCD8841971.1 molybdopterin-guanine dinucleotide biosynthesis protein B [Staphylococcus arlettae]
MILQIVGYKNSGKTTLMEHTVALLKAHNLRVVTIKNHGHIDDEITLQHSNVDHMKHFNAGADQAIVQGNYVQQSVTRQPKQNLSTLIDSSVTIDCDITLVEGFKHEDFDKVVIHRDQEALTELLTLTNVQYSLTLNDQEALNDYNLWLRSFITAKGLIT